MQNQPLLWMVSLKWPRVSPTSVSPKIEEAKMDTVDSALEDLDFDEEQLKSNFVVFSMPAGELGLDMDDDSNDEKKPSQPAPTNDSTKQNIDSAETTKSSNNDDPFDDDEGFDLSGLDIDLDSIFGDDEIELESTPEQAQPQGNPAQSNDQTQPQLQLNAQSQASTQPEQPQSAQTVPQPTQEEPESQPQPAQPAQPSQPNTRTSPPLSQQSNPSPGSSPSPSGQLCPACSNPISGVALRAGGKVWHKECFR